MYMKIPYSKRTKGIQLKRLYIDNFLSLIYQLLGQSFQPQSTLCVCLIKPHKVFSHFIWLEVVLLEHAARHNSFQFLNDHLLSSSVNYDKYRIVSAE